MRKIIFVLPLLSIGFLNSCSKDDSDDVVVTDPIIEEEVDSKLLKTWQCTSISIEGTGNITGAPVGSFQGTGFDFSDFEITFKESASSLVKNGDYSLNVDITTTTIPINEFDIEDRTEFPIGTFTENGDNTITVASATADDVNMTVLDNTDTDLTLLVNLEYEYTPVVFNSVISCPSQVTFQFKAKN